MQRSVPMLSIATSRLSVFFVVRRTKRKKVLYSFDSHVTFSLDSISVTLIFIHSDLPQRNKLLE